jgi:hypothetical protein
LNEGHGGKQVKSRESKIGSTCFGKYTYPGILGKPSGADMLDQNILFQDDDVGTCWMTPEEGLRTKYNIEVPGETTKEHMRVGELLWEHLRRHFISGALPSEFDKLTKSQL